MNGLIFVMLGGAIGAGGRYLLSLGLAARFGLGAGFPAPTFIANLLGGLLMGLITGLIIRGNLGESARLFLGVGVLGGFTTFSAFSLESFRMIEGGQIGLAAGYGLASVIGSIMMLAIGLWLTRVAA